MKFSKDHDRHEECEFVSKSQSGLFKHICQEHEDGHNLQFWNKFNFNFIPKSAITLRCALFRLALWKNLSELKAQRMVRSEERRLFQGFEGYKPYIPRSNVGTSKNTNQVKSNIWFRPVKNKKNYSFLINIKSINNYFQADSSGEELTHYTAI